MTALATPSSPSLAAMAPLSLPELVTGDAHDLLARHADNPSAFLALNEGTEHFRSPGVDGLIAYRRAGRRHLVQLGGVFAAPEDQDRLLGAFLAFARSERRKVVAVQLQRDDAERYAAAGFTVNQFGANFARALEGFSLKGTAFMKLRNKISKARRSGITVAEVDDLDTSGLDAMWLRDKGRHVKELEFMVGERGGPAQRWRRTFAATAEDGTLLGYISFSPAFGRRPGWLHDLSRRHPEAPPGTMELLVISAVEAFQGEGAGFLHFGLTPFTHLDEANEIEGAASPMARRIVRLLADKGEKVYPAADQVAYKLKWAPDVIEPEYVAFAGGVRLGSVWALLRLTNAA
jgi:lysylphosphatidylglycerol synthetase-like protein (DUF2156 family)